MNILVQLFWICLIVLESDYEHEFLLGLRLLEKVLSKLPLDRPDVREKIEKLQVLSIVYSDSAGPQKISLRGRLLPISHIIENITLIHRRPNFTSFCHSVST